MYFHFSPLVTILALCLWFMGMILDHEGIPWEGRNMPTPRRVWLRRDILAHLAVGLGFGLFLVFAYDCARLALLLIRAH